MIKGGFRNRRAEGSIFEAQPLTQAMLNLDNNCNIVRYRGIKSGKVTQK